MEDQVEDDTHSYVSTEDDMTMTIVDRMIQREQERMKQQPVIEKESVKEVKQSAIPDDSESLANEADKLLTELKQKPLASKKRKLTTLLNKMIKADLISKEDKKEILESI